MSPTSPPFSWVSPSAQPRLLAGLAVLLVALSAALLLTTPDLVSDAAPHGIVSFEFALTEAGARRILESWSSQAREQAMFSLGLDMLYLFVYPAFLSLACQRLARGHRVRSPGLASSGLLIAWLVLFAGALDAVENAALFRLLTQGSAQPWAGLAAVCAAPKFALVAVASGYALVALVVRWLRAS